MSPGQQVKAVPLANPIPPLAIVIGYLADNPRRLVRTFIDQCLAYFESPEASRLMVALDPST